VAGEEAAAQVRAAAAPFGKVIVPVWGYSLNLDVPDAVGLVITLPGGLETHYPMDLEAAAKLAADLAAPRLVKPTAGDLHRHGGSSNGTAHK
jgi:hypothetical protein